MTQVLYRKYRPQTFSEIKGQEHVIETLKGAIKLNRVAHAYLFCGPRGIGKTSIARIFAKALNCEKRINHEPCNSCSTCLAINNNQSIDIIEIDGASNRGIDDIRNIKEIAQVAASQNRYKIFIIDEVHSLTKDAFNALLKILEEPPEHVKFILATTEPHKLLDTVLSRVQRFDLKKLSHAQIIKKLEEVSEKEKVKVEKDVFRLIAVNSEGSLRDAESNFAKLIALSGNNINLEDIKDILGFIPFELYVRFMNSLINKQKEEGVKLVNELYETGVDLENFTKGFTDFTRKIIIAKASQDTMKSFQGELNSEQLAQIEKFAQSIDTKLLIKIINFLMNVRNEIKTSPIPQLPLELAVMEFTSTEI